MTRRQLFRRRPLSLQAYIHRATVGLPKAERLDAAAELRTHLVERIDALRAEGHPADEAEFLAVQAMGDPAPTNRGLLGHAFTHRLGWLALGLVVIGGGGWYGYGYAQREWMPPREGVEYTGDLTLDDLKALNADENAPKGTYQGATLTYPRGTKGIYYLLVTPKRTVLTSRFLSVDVANQMRFRNIRRAPGSYRHQERWLIISSQNTTACPGRWEPHADIRSINSKYMPGVSIPNLYLSDLPLEDVNRGACTGINRLFEQHSNYQTEVYPKIFTPNIYRRQDLPLNSWTLLQSFVLAPSKADNGSQLLKTKIGGMYFAVFPSDKFVTDAGYWAISDEDSGYITVASNNASNPIPTPPQFSMKLGIFQ